MKKPRIIYSEGENIKVGKDKFALVSDEDFEEVSKQFWFPNKGYARSNMVGLMHRMVYERMTGSKVPKGMWIDHINRDGYDNRRENIRLCTQGQNVAYSQRPKSKWGYRGVYCSKRRYAARISYEGKRTYSGWFDTPEEAAKAYNKIALELYGEFANLNEI